VSVAGRDCLLELDSVTVRFGGRDVLTDADLAIARGEIIGVSGPNGAGKTTLLRVAANMLRPATGRRIGQPRLAYVPAAVDPPLLQAGVWLAGVRRARRAPPSGVLEQLGFDGAIDRPCRELSFGNLRKVLLADAFSSLADLIVIDEATEGLDSRGAAALVELMVEARGRSAGVLFAEQQTQRMVGADRLVTVRRGTLAVEQLSGGEVTVSLRGPAQALSELTKGAEALGFRYIVERE
jgi:zinc transport system ATP-binding protein